MMRFPILIRFLAAGLLFHTGPLALAQSTDTAFPTETGATTSLLSPFSHLSPLTKGGNPRLTEHNICAPYVYYNPTGSTITYSQTVPTSVWATRLTPLSTAASVCTVWTITTDFELTNAPLTAKDTIQIIIRDGTPPYSQLWTTWFIARVGTNIGEIEIDPPVVPPFTRPVIYPKRDIYVGFYVRGGSTHTVNFKFKSPQLYSNPFRSVKFTSPNTFISAASATGQNVEWVFEANMCCDYVVPVELSSFSGTFDGRSVDLLWTTESETSNAGFEIQRSRALAGPWTTIGVVAGNGTTTRQLHYQYTDRTPVDPAQPLPLALWYRLVQSDYDGTRNELPPVSVAVARMESQGFVLHAGYPNPFSVQSNAAMTIPYQLAEESDVRLSVHDALGREIGLAFQGHQSAGYHEALWYPHSASMQMRSGNYFIRLSTPSSSTTRKVSILE